MRTRILSAAVLLPLAIGLVVAGGVAFTAGVAAMCALALWECWQLFGLASAIAPAPTWRYATATVGAAAVADIYLASSYPRLALAGAGLLLIVSLLGLLLVGNPARHFAAWGISVASLLYIAGLGAHFVLLRQSTQGLGWTFLACAATWATDIGAYFAGRRFGKRPFFKAISPKKTLEGAIGGLAAGVLASVAVVLIAGLKVPLAVILPLGLSLSIVTQGGDLVESMLKREAGVKDSGTLIPGHGGMLDRIDSLLFAVALAFYWRLLFA